MKKLIIVLGLSLMSTYGFSQQISAVDYLTWSNSTVFKTSPPPAITGYGDLSASLYDNLGNIHFVFGDEYYKIDSWASYYYWFTQKYFFLFPNPEVYEYYYKSKNDKEMVRYIAKSYIGDILPSKIDFKGLQLKNNKMFYTVNADDEVKVKELESFIKKHYSKEEESKYLEKRKDLSKQIEKNIEIENQKTESKTQVSQNSSTPQNTKSITNSKTKKGLKKN